MNGYIIYHPRRVKSTFGDVKVYHDSTQGNQDPYVWNQQFLHTYCHMTKITPEVNHINFWVSGDTFPNFSALYCDLVFVVERKDYWSEANSIDYNDPIIDNREAFIDHYRWAMYQHLFKKRRRFTLKADSKRSFQPQDVNQQLIDIVPFLERTGFELELLRRGLRSGFASKPLRLNTIALDLYEWLSNNATIKLSGKTLEIIRKANQQLASPDPK
jgi:hypothetical protein